MCNLYRLHKGADAIRQIFDGLGHQLNFPGRDPQPSADRHPHHRSGADRSDGARMAWRWWSGAGAGRGPMASRYSTCGRKGAAFPTAAWRSPTASTNSRRPTTPRPSARTNGFSRRSRADCIGIAAVTQTHPASRRSVQPADGRAVTGSRRRSTTGRSSCRAPITGWSGSILRPAFRLQATGRPFRRSASPKWAWKHRPGPRPRGSARRRRRRHKP